MATTEDKVIAKEILLKLIETNNLSYDEFPEVKGIASLICSFYSKILETVSKN